MNKDLSGQVFGRLSVLHLDSVRGEQTYWFCRCSCGTEKAIRRDGLTTGRVTGCGCGLKNKPPRGPDATVADISGQRFGQILVLGRSTEVHRYGAAFDCLCDCGVRFRAIKGHLLAGKVTSCGCKRVTMKKAEFPNGNVFLGFADAPGGNRRGLFRCGCGNEFRAVISAVRSAATSSCGCFGAAIRRMARG